MCYITTLSGWIDSKNVKMSRWIPHYAAAIWLHNKKHHILTYKFMSRLPKPVSNKRMGGNEGGWIGGMEQAGKINSSFVYYSPV